jgi:hypothetical protein
MLFLGPPTFGFSKYPVMTRREDNSILWQFQEVIEEMGRQKHFDVLSLYNLTVQASTADGVSFGEKVVLVEAMMIINWLSKLETS